MKAFVKSEAERGLSAGKAHRKRSCRQRISNFQESGRSSTKFGLTTKRDKEHHECHSQLPKSSLTVIEVFFQDSLAALTRKYDVKHPILFCNHVAAQAYGGLPDLPRSFFINRHGIIVAVTDGADSEQEIEDEIRDALASK